MYSHAQPEQLPVLLPAQQLGNLAGNCLEVALKGQAGPDLVAELGWGDAHTQLTDPYAEVSTGHDCLTDGVFHLCRCYCLPSDFDLRAQQGLRQLPLS